SSLSIPYHYSSLNSLFLVGSNNVIENAQVPSSSRLPFNRSFVRGCPMGMGRTWILWWIRRMGRIRRLRMEETV
ncbi:hypothetical protein PMAYCL1PPCAC_29688, partial [Pristionchus mayeri]